MNILLPYIVTYSNKDLLYTQNLLSRFKTMEITTDFLLVDIILVLISALLLSFLVRKDCVTFVLH